MSTATYVVNGPASGTTYYAGVSGEVVPNASTGITVQVQAFTGANGTGGLQVCGSLEAIIRNVTASSTLGSWTGNGGNTTIAGPDTGGNGSDVYAGGTLWSGSGSPGSIVITITYTGRPYLQASVRRSGSWTQLSDLQLRRGGAWSSHQGLYVRRSGTWVQIG